MRCIFPFEVSFLDIQFRDEDPLKLLALLQNKALVVGVHLDELLSRLVRGHRGDARLKCERLAFFG